MNYERMEAIQDELYDRIQEIRETKGREYATDADTLADFKEVAEAAGVTPLQVWLTYVEKHQRAIATYVREGDVKSEAIEDRILDVVVYHALLLGLIEDMCGQESAPVGVTTGSAQAGGLADIDLDSDASTLPSPKMEFRSSILSNGEHRPTPWDIIGEYRGRIMNVRVLTEINHRLREHGWAGTASLDSDGHLLHYRED